MRSADVALEGSELRIRVPKAFQLALRDEAVAKAAQKLAGRPVKVIVETAAAATAAEPPGPAAPVQDSAQFSERVLQHPGVKRFQELFPDAQVRTVRNLNE